MPAPETPHRLVNPETLSPPVGFAHAVVAAPGQLVFLGGQTSHDAEGICCGDTLVEQFDIALQNVVTALDAAGSSPEHLVSMQIFVTDAASYANPSASSVSVTGSGSTAITLRWRCSR